MFVLSSVRLVNQFQYDVSIILASFMLSQNICDTKINQALLYANLPHDMCQPTQYMGQVGTGAEVRKRSFFMASLLK
jgi:hypothetical protein